MSIPVDAQLKVLGLSKGQSTRVETHISLCLSLDSEQTNFPFIYIPPAFRSSNRSVETPPPNAFLLEVKVYTMDGRSIDACNKCKDREERKLSKKGITTSANIIDIKGNGIREFQSGTLVLSLRLTCYSRHWNTEGFVLCFSICDSFGAKIEGVSEMIKVCDMHKNKKRKQDFDEGMMASSTLPCPEIHKVVPCEGSILGGNQVTLLGSCFHSGMKVFFGGKEALVEVWTPNCVVCVVPIAEKEDAVDVTCSGNGTVVYMYSDDSRTGFLDLALSIIGENAFENVLFNTGSMEQRLISQFQTLPKSRLLTSNKAQQSILHLACFCRLKTLVEFLVLINPELMEAQDAFGMYALDVAYLIDWKEGVNIFNPTNEETSIVQNIWNDILDVWNNVKNEIPAIHSSWSL